MFIWEVEKMALMNNHADINNGRYKITVYACESSVSREDKIAFVDGLQDGKLSYLLSLIEKFNAEKDSLPQKQVLFGESEVKTISLKAWINKNDTKYQRPLIDNDYQYGKYRIVGCERNIQSNRKGDYDYYEDLVDEVFRRQLKECEQAEQKYFHEHDEYSILKKKFEEKQNQYRTTFGAEIWTGSGGVQVVQIGDSDKRRKLTIDELKELISKYEQIEELVKKLTEETHIVY